MISRRLKRNAVAFRCKGKSQETGIESCVITDNYYGVYLLGAKENPKKRELKDSMSNIMYATLFKVVQRKIPRNGN